MTWQTLGQVGGEALVNARLEAHWAAQVLGAAADGYLPHAADDSHTSMAWDDVRRAMLGEPAPSGLRLALAIDELSLLAIRDGKTLATMGLAGETLASAVAWADAQLANAGGGAPRGIAVRDYDMPDHPVRTGGRFSRDPAALDELAAWYAIGAESLAPVAAMPGAVALRVWPHHFDLGTIVFFGDTGEHARQIGVGLSPGDGTYAEPYFYVTPFPITADARLPELAGGGAWRREGWTGAVLTATAITASADRAGRRARTAAFVTSAVEGSRVLVGA